MVDMAILSLYENAINIIGDPFMFQIIVNGFSKRESARTYSVLWKDTASSPGSEAIGLSSLSPVILESMTSARAKTVYLGQ